MTTTPNTFRGEARSAKCGKGLTEDDIRAIRALPGPLSSIGAQFNISAPMVHFIRRGLRWAHVKELDQ